MRALKRSSAVLCGAVFGAVLSALAASCHSLPADSTAVFREGLRSVLPPLEWGKLPGTDSQDSRLSPYWERFSADGGVFPLSWNLLGLGESAMAVLTVPPREGSSARGVVLFFHGYLSHNGNFLDLFRFLSGEGWWVVAADLPGHGLSGPRVRGSIKDFSGYGTAVERVMGWISSIEEWKSLPLAALGHSTGAAALLVYHQSHPQAFPGMILSAPLVRPVFYGPASLGIKLVSPWTSFLPSAESGDPLGVPYVPLEWFRALEVWNTKISGYKKIETPLLVLSGDRDQVVDTGYNTGTVISLYPRSQLKIFPGRDHFLLQDRNQREVVFAEIRTFLAQLSP